MSDQPIDTFSFEERERICNNLDALHQEVERGELNPRLLDRAFVEDINRRLWADVRTYGGKIRAKGEGPEVLIILGKRSPKREDVPRLIDELLTRLNRRCEQLGALAPAMDAIEIAVQAHVDLIRMQPFTDGNKRTARLLLSVVLVRCGLNAVDFGVPKEDYVNAITAAFDGDPRPMTDLVIELLAAQATPG